MKLWEMIAVGAAAVVLLSFVGFVVYQAFCGGGSDKDRKGIRAFLGLLVGVALLCVGGAAGIQWLLGLGIACAILFGVYLFATLGRDD